MKLFFGKPKIVIPLLVFPVFDLIHPTHLGYLLTLFAALALGGVALYVNLSGRRDML